MPDENIRVTFERVDVRNDGDWIGTGEWYFIASVDGSDVGDRRAIFDNARENQPIPLEAADWHGIVNVRNKSSVSFSFQAKDKDVFRDDDMGTIRHTLNRPYGETTDTIQSRNFDLTYRVELEVAGSYGPHPAGTVFATRRNADDTPRYATVSGAEHQPRMEICPVWPVPPDANMPTRPAVPAGAVIVRNGAAKNVQPGGDINIIPNPAVIPLLSDPAPAAGPAPALPAGAPPRATAQNAALIEYTYYWPQALNLTDNDPRLEWEITPAANAAFIGGNRGRKVKVYGKNAGNVLLRLRLEGALFAEYRAVVKEIKRIPFRANILNGPNAASQPRATPEDVENHIAVANRFLRQAGLELVPDTNTTRTHSATATGRDGIFRIRVSANRTRNVHGNYPQTAVLNSRANVLNIQYIHSIQAPVGWVIFGRAVDFPANGSGNSIQDTLTPTPSWIRPAGGGCGVAPDPAPGAAIVMNLLPAHQRNNPANRFTLLITDGNGDPTTAAGRMTYGNVVAHELGHVLNLRHRVGAGPDGLAHPPRQNIMCQGEPADVRQDFDRLQAEAMHDSPLVP